jgi:phytanoyl-CoA hydroxylase
LVEDRVPGFRGRIYEASVRPRLAAMSPAERGDAVRKLFRFVAHEPRLAALSEQPAMLTIIRSLLECRTPRLFQDMALLKPPRIGREKPWHQDHAFFDFSLETRFLGVWIALDPATIENGCMHVLDGGHRAGPRLHFRRRDFQICDTELLGQRSVAFPLEPGDALFFDGLLPHGTPANDSPLRRRALQFHYCTEDAAELESGFRLKVFGAEGKDVSC